ncbi:MAG: translation elongation factor Ts [Chthonomonas sp.]|nr:translation elongation factor Ts [Chthonomonas sp.]
MAISAQDVKKLRDLTGAPMGECKAALEEANGDFEAAQNILREKGQAAAAKRAGRSTSEGAALIALSGDSSKAAGLILESETDFVANNDNFKELSSKLVNGLLTADLGSDPMAATIDGTSVAKLVEEGVALMRENIQLKKAIQVEGEFVGGYTHHDRKSSALVVFAGKHDKAAEIAKNIGMQVVSLRPSFLTKEEIPAEVIDKEYELQKRRAIEEGKPENIAENIAKGRINKEFFQEAVLLEQPYFIDSKRTVAQYVKDESGGALEIKSFVRLAVGESSDESGE